MAKFAKKAVLIGAGNIGKGYLADLFESAGYSLTFLTHSLKQAERLRERGSYTIYKTAETLDCFLSLDICSKVDQDGNLPHMEIVKKMGVWCSLNGKTNVGLGRPLYQEK